MGSVRTNSNLGSVLHVSVPPWVRLGSWCGSLCQCRRLLPKSKPVATRCVIGKKDGSHSRPEYGLLFSASAGCLSCVRFWVERECMSLALTSDHHIDRGVRSCAEWCKDSGGKRKVFEYLDRYELPSANREESPLLQIWDKNAAGVILDCPGPIAHTHSTNEFGQLPCAARDGCVNCCSYFISVCKVSFHGNALGILSV